MRKYTNILVTMLKSHITGNYITLRGELIISSTGLSNVDNHEYEQLSLEENIAHIKDLLPGVKISVTSGICDITIHFFIYNQVVRCNDIYEKMKEEFSVIADKVYDYEGHLNLRIDVVANTTSMGEKEEVRFLNKERVVEYRIVKKEYEDDLISKIRKTICQKRRE